MAKIADRIRQERTRRFVGRASEISLFADVLKGTSEYVVLSVYGPGGVGKTTLLRQFEEATAAAGRPFVTLDGRNLQPNPQTFLGALCMFTGQPTPADAIASVAGGVIFIDTFEAIEPLNDWIRESFVPDLPETTIVVILGRKRPSVQWRQDVWQTLCRPIPLRNLSDHDARAFLAARQVPEDEQTRILGFTYGHPLALTLAADTYSQTGGFGATDGGRTDVVAMLLDRFVEGINEPVHRELLEICALARMMTEALIAEVLDREQAPALFAWLKSLSFIETTPFGLMPHDLARDAILAELKWRNPDRYSDLHHRARAYYSDRFDRSTGLAQQQVLFDFIYLHRENPVIGPSFQWNSGAAAFVDAARPDDLPEILRILSKHEGEAAAELGQFWFDRQPGAFIVLRESGSRLAGLLIRLDAAAADPVDAARDPAVAKALSYLDATAPLRKGEKAIVFRFWMADDGYQSVSPVQSAIFLAIVQTYLTEPGLAATFLPCAEPEMWTPMFTYAVHTRLTAADFATNGTTHGVFFCDWRVLPPKQWLQVLSEREVPMKETAEARHGTPDVVVLSQETFAASVLEALKGFNNSSRLAQNPLLRSRLVLEQSGQDADVRERMRILREQIVEASKTLNANAKDAKLFEALQAGYLRSKRSQEAAAEAVDVSIATFRRHLKAGVERVTGILWQQETGL